MQQLKTSSKRAVQAIVGLSLILTATFAIGSSTNLPDGQLAESAYAQTGVGIQQPLGTEFNAANGPLTFSGTVDPTSVSSGGAYNVGITVGNVYFLVHPGYSPIPGAFRFDSINLATSLVFPNTNGGNKSLGFTPNADPIDFEVVLNTDGSNYSFDVSIKQSSNSFVGSYVLPQDIFGVNGAIASFGPFHNGLGAGWGVLDYSNFTANTGIQSTDEQIATLVNDVISLNLKKGISNALDSKLDNVLRALQDENDNNDVAAINGLYAFCSSVDAQSGKQITEGDAATLIASVNGILSSIDDLATHCQ